MTSLVFAVHLAVSFAMVGVIWVVQLVHYPLFAGVGADGWAAYERAHQQRITWLVGPLMLAELATAVLLVLDRPAAMPLAAAVTGAALVGAIWASTAFVQVPLHAALGGAFDAAAHSRLVGSNWVRTVLWTVRGALLAWIVAGMG